MTGYGESQGEIDGVTYAVTIKAVNNRYLKAIVKLPDLVAFLDEDVERLLRSKLGRGTLNCTVRLKDISGGSLFEIDESALQSVVERLTRIELSGKLTGSVDIASLLNLPGITRPVEPDEATAERIVAIEAVDGVLLVKGDRIAVAGHLPPLVRNRDADLTVKVTRDASLPG